VVSRFDLAEKVPTLNSFETDLAFVGRNAFDISRKYYRARTIFDAAEDEQSSIWIRLTVHPISTCRKGFAGNYKLVGYVDHDLIDRLALGGLGQTGGSD
ncbi:MAG: hypothetical protein WBW14_10120, partial [Candidatus Acidiferrum sp.]